MQMNYETSPHRLNELLFLINAFTDQHLLFIYQADTDDEGFDLIQPSLIQQLRSILDQYPDDGQILKVQEPCIHHLHHSVV